MTSPGLESRDCLVRWLAHLSERSVRLHAYLTSVAANAPRIGDRPPPVVKAMLAESEQLVNSIRDKLLKVRSYQARNQPDLQNIYQGVERLVITFLTLHGKLSHLPKEWVRAEIELFLRSIGGAVNDAALSLLRGSQNLLEHYTVISTPAYNFANLLDAGVEHSSGIEDDEYYLARHDLLSLPVIEQHTTLYWPFLVHELGHSIYHGSMIKEDPNIAHFLEQAEGQIRYKLRDFYTEEVFCDLFAAAVCGPMYYVSFATFACYWVTAPLQVSGNIGRGVEPTHPPPDTRLQYVYKFLAANNPDLMGPIGSQIGQLVDRRKALDYAGSNAKGRIEDYGDRVFRKAYPSESDILALSRLISESPIFRTLTCPIRQFDVGKIIELQTRFADGEFIGTSSAGTLPGPIELVNIADKFEAYARALEEKENSVFDILTATSCHQTDILLSEEQERNYVRSGLKGFPSEYIDDLICSESDSREFVASAAEYIHGADAAAIKSIEASGIGRFYGDKQ